MLNNINWLIDNWVQDELLKAELYRESGNFQQCIETLSNVNVTDDFLLRIKDEIIRLAEVKDSSVFEITNL